MDKKDVSNFITYKTSSPAGDLISFLAGVKEMHRQTGKKGVIYQRLNMPGVSYKDSIHPFTNEEGEPVCMPKSMYLMLKPLLEIQLYIEGYLIYEGQKVDFDFDFIRLNRFTGQPNGSLNRWFNYCFPQMASDLSNRWLGKAIPFNSTAKGKILINFTQRHRNHLISYQFLKKYQDKILFVGLAKERDIFCKQHDLDIAYYEIIDFLHLASIIDSCTFFMGNQSFCFQLAEALKAPRILETFPMMPNVIPIGENAFDFYEQAAVEYYFDKLLNK